jgi:hypothetical protein
MQTPCRHGNQKALTMLAMALAALVLAGGGVSGQSLQSLLNNAPTTTAPAVKFAPKPHLHPFAEAHGPASAVRAGSVQLSTGRVITGRIWTTQQTPFRVWLAGIKQYRDIDIRLIRQIVGTIRYARQIRQYKFQQMGSDIKLYTGKTRPRIGYQFTFRLINGKSITGTVIAPIYIRTPAGKQYFYLLKKRIEGKLGQRADSISYVKKIDFQVTPVDQKYAAAVTRRLPLVHWRRLLAHAAPH